MRNHHLVGSRCRSTLAFVSQKRRCACLDHALLFTSNLKEKTEMPLNWEPLTVIDSGGVRAVLNVAILKGKPIYSMAVGAPDADYTSRTRRFVTGAKDEFAQSLTNLLTALPTIGSAIDNFEKEHAKKLAETPVRSQSFNKPGMGLSRLAAQDASEKGVELREKPKKPSNKEDKRAKDRAIRDSMKKTK